MRALLRTPRVRTKLLVTVVAVLLYRIGQNAPSPGADVAALRDAAAAAVRDDPVYALFDLLTGGALLHLSVLGLGVLPHVAAAVTMGLLTGAVPRLRALAAEPGGAARIRRYTDVLAVAAGAAMGTAAAAAASRGRLPGGDVLTGAGPAAVAASLTAGTAVTVLLLRLIDARGFGHGLALLFFTQVSAVFPRLLADVRDTGGTGAFAAALAVVLLTALLTVAALTALTQAERRVPVQYARRMVGVRAPRGGKVHIPVPLHRTGLRAVLIALAVLHVPALAARLWPGGGLPDGLWTAPLHGSAWFLLALFTLAVLARSASSLGTLDVAGTANRLAREGAFVPGIRPGRPTADYLAYVRSRVGFTAPLVLGLLAVLPHAALALLGVGAPHLGTSVLIVLGAGLGTATRTVRQAVAEQKMHEYAPCLRTGSAEN
ncbi:preprotein translocase subunit SecY [Actinomadura rifamycini]|uniref:preprotein translocase subunit SecY n=1 Tax=Actinomadura rifamycini TaxID=31962 RepID=UPI00047E007A|nr:preprotein translocase subunit SecY [Actinomadura rifamycini]